MAIGRRERESLVRPGGGFSAGHEDQLLAQSFGDAGLPQGPETLPAGPGVI